MSLYFITTTLIKATITFCLDSFSSLVAGLFAFILAFSLFPIQSSFRRYRSSFNVSAQNAFHCTWNRIKCYHGFRGPIPSLPVPVYLSLSCELLFLAHSTSILLTNLLLNPQIHQGHFCFISVSQTCKVFPTLGFYCCSPA